jgi:hypothetical protein
MIESLEVSQTNRAKCSKCSTNIDKGNLRGKVHNDRFNSYNYYCEKCTYEKVLESIDKLNKMKQELENAGVLSRN